MEGWFAADAETISLKAWDEVCVIHPVVSFDAVGRAIDFPIMRCRDFDGIYISKTTRN